MVSTALLLVDPVLARLMFFHLPAGVAGRVAFRNFCVGTVAVLMLFFVLPLTGAWAAFTLWFRAVPLT